MIWKPVTEYVVRCFDRDLQECAPPIICRSLPQAIRHRIITLARIFGRRAHIRHVVITVRFEHQIG